MAESIKKARRRSTSKHQNKDTQRAAHNLAYSLTENATASNIDLKVTVAGYTHRNGFKLTISNIEEISDVLIENWKNKCLKVGYKCTVAYNASLSTAVLHATKLGSSNSLLDTPDANSLVETNMFKKVHPLTILAGVMFLLNVGRHYFVHESVSI